jgi:hypothetical protein
LFDASDSNVSPQGSFPGARFPNTTVTLKPGTFPVVLSQQANATTTVVVAAADHNFCPGTGGGLGDITFSGTRQNGMFSGTFTIINSTNHVLLKSGSITSGNIQSGSYTVQGTETVDSLCNTSVPTAITVNGQCGTGVTINFRAANGETAIFTGNVKCVSS